jgi:hypothetical protein
MGTKFGHTFVSKDYRKRNNDEEEQFLKRNIERKDYSQGLT